MDQDQIDELLESSDSDVPKNNKTKQKQKSQAQLQEEYDEQFQEEAEVGQQAAKQKQNESVKDQQQYAQSSFAEEPIESEKPEDQIDKIQSEYASEVYDQMDQEIENISNQYASKDDDLSLAQSDFIESVNLNDAEKIGKARINSIGSKKNLKSSSKQLVKNVKPKENNQTKTKINSQKKIEQKKVINKPVQTNKKPVQGKKLSQEEIQQKMKQIQDKKNELLKIKKQKQKKEAEKKKQQYEQAMALEKEKKEKNKQAFEEQMKKKKEGKGKDSRVTGKTQNIDIEAKKQIEEKSNNKGNYQYMQMKKQRKQAQKNVQKQIQLANKQKLKNLQPKTQVNKVKKQENKKKILQDKNCLKSALVKGKQQQAKEQDTLITKQTKLAIKNLTAQNRIKKQKINQFQKSIIKLQAQLKEIQKVYYEGESADIMAKQSIQHTDVSYSDLTDIEKFVASFPQCGSSQQIFNLIDENKDGVLSVKEIKDKLVSLYIDESISQSVHTTLDENSDGKVTIQQFSFIIDSEVQRQRKYRQIMGEIDTIDPLQIEARIIDMRSKIHFIDGKLNMNNTNQSQYYEQKYQQYLSKIQKIQKKAQRDNEAGQVDHDDPSNIQRKQKMKLQAHRLKAEKQMKQKLIKSLAQSTQTNLKQKNQILQMKVEENLTLKEKNYNLINKIQQQELRFLSLQKIAQNKKGYMEKRAKEQNQIQQVLRQAQQYKVLVSDPTKQLKNRTLQRQTRFLAAVIMIQRNFRKKKALREFQKKKNAQGENTS